MAASPYSQHPSHVASMPSKLQGDGILKLAAIYGANAAGKTKLVDALRSLRSIVVNGSAQDRRLPVDSFKLSEHTKNIPVQFEVVFSIADKTFQYGLVVSSSGLAIEEEWLYILSGGRQTKCFERLTKKSDVVVDLGSGFARKGTKEYEKLLLIADATSASQSYVTKAWENKSQVAAMVVSWFRDHLTIIGAEADYEALEFQAAVDDSFSGFLSNYLKAAGTGIDEVFSEEIEIDVEKRFKNLDPVKREEVLRDISAGAGVVLVSPGGSVSKVASNSKGVVVEYRLKAGHNNDAGGVEYFDFRGESHGTQRLTHLLPAMYESRRAQRVYVIDELDRKLHPLLTQKFVADFVEGASVSNSQLVFTTHDTNLLDQGNLRRDEIWFVEKNTSTGEAALFPLTDFDVRADLRIDKGYLNGRFGAIPFFGGCKLPD